MAGGEGSGQARGKSERIAVPAMPMPLAVICCILNFLVPGLGTIIAGFSSCCCSRNDDMSGCERCGSCSANFLIGILQLLFTAILLLGWIWSCIWGFSFIGMSAEYYHDSTRRRAVRPDESSAGVVTQQPGVGPSYGQDPIFNTGQYMHNNIVTQPPAYTPQQHYPPHPHAPGWYEPPPSYEESVAPSAPPLPKYN